MGAHDAVVWSCGEVTLPSRYVLDDLRPSMVVALLADAFWKREVVIHQVG